MLPSAVAHRRRLQFIHPVSLCFVRFYIDSLRRLPHNESCNFSDTRFLERKNRKSASQTLSTIDHSHAERCLAANHVSPVETLLNLSNAETCKHSFSRSVSLILPPKPQLENRSLHRITVNDVRKQRNLVSVSVQNVHKPEGLGKDNDLSNVTYVRENEEPEKIESIESIVIGGKSRRRSKVEALSELQQKVGLLRSERASLSDVDALLKRRAFKSASPEQLVAVFKVLRDFCPSGEKACKVLVKNAGVIGQPVQNLRQKLKVLHEFEVGEEACLTLATSVYMLTVKTEKLRETLQFLKDIGLSVESINKIICKKPQTLRLSVQSSMQPTVDFLLSIGMSNVKILKLLERRPELFAMSVDNNLMVKYEFFKHLGLSVEKFSSALRSMTQFSNDTILARLDTIKKHGFSDADVQEMIQRQPNILANSSEAIKNKLDYLLDQQNRTIQEIVKFPACLGCSLEKRIIPRFKFLEENGLSKPYSLSTILARKESDFIGTCKLFSSMKK